MNEIFNMEKAEENSLLAKEKLKTCKEEVQKAIRREMDKRGITNIMLGEKLAQCGMAASNSHACANFRAINKPSVKTLKFVYSLIVQGIIDKEPNS